MPSQHHIFLNQTQSCRKTSYAAVLLLGTCLSASAAFHDAYALNLYSGTMNGQDLEINLETGLEYSNILRVNNPSAILAGPNDLNGNDGDSNFRHGDVDNTFDVVPVFDLKYGEYGIHISGEAYLDTPYLGKNQNNQPASFNPYTTASNRDFTSATRNLNGENAELLDAFAYGSENFGADDNQVVTVKLGRQTLLWGQSLFFTNNGIAAGQAPQDVIKAQSLPNPQAQQIFQPVGQAVLTYQPNQILTLQGYYQFEWEPNTYESSGSYFSSTDFFAGGGQRLILKPGVYEYRGKDNRPTHNGQFGISAQADIGAYGVGLYALRFDSKGIPETYSGVPLAGQPAHSAGTYYFIYPRDIAIYGASLSTTVEDANVSGEISGRTHMPLTSVVGLLTKPGNADANANDHPLYAVGNTLHGQVSTTYTSTALSFDPGGVSLAAEIELNHVLMVTANKAALTPGRDATAGAFDISLTPAYYDVLPQLELQFPLSVRYAILGNSRVDSTSNRGTGTLDVGITATYKTTWITGLTYQDFFGKPSTVYNSLADRGFVSFNIQHTF